MNTHIRVFELACIQTDTYILELAQQIDEGSLAKWMGETCVKCHGRVFRRQCCHPFLLLIKFEQLFSQQICYKREIEYNSCKTCAFQNIRVKVIWGMRFPKQLKVQMGQSYDASKLDKTKEGGRKKEVLVSDRRGKCFNFAPTSASQCQSILKSQIYLE